VQIDRGINQTCDDLTQLLGSICLPFCEDSVESCKLVTSVFGEDRSVVYSIANLAVSQQRVAVSAVGSDTYFAIPLDRDRPQIGIGVGVLRNTKPEIANQLATIAAEATYRSEELSRQHRSILDAERELKRSFDERAWLRDLNSHHAKRDCAPSYNARQVLESARRFLRAEAVAAYVYPDQDAKHSGLASTIVSNSSLSIADLRYLLHRVAKPSLGGQTVNDNLHFVLGQFEVRNVTIVPLGESEVIGFAIAINTQLDAPSQLRVEVLRDVADFMIADGYTASIVVDGERLVLGTLHSMSIAIEARDPYTHGHSERVAQYAVKIGEQMSLSEASCQEIYLAGVLHDIGKIGIPDAVLLKAGKLTTEEFAVIQQHPEIGYKIIEELGKLKFALPGILYHHERFDGRGYPHHLEGEEIPLMGRILAVADAFDAMTTSRVYRNAMDRSRACQILQEGRGTQWDANAVDACMTWLERSNHMLQPEPNFETMAGNKRGMLSRALRALQR
jgi:HD-GYP domain-containing protein (c-di-GMP phosphodiesterase class II)